MPIKILESAIIDQIAAGEVVDRPAHMIKELVENAIDAGATEVTVDFSEGGRRVTVSDNGHGIPPEELPLAIARHATSKIATTEDLWQIASYGFRGEALASIAAVSHFRIISRAKNSDLGAALEVNFGQVGTTRAVGSEVGTTIEIRDLFQNIPARLKFLKSDAAEASQVKNQLKALALANRNIIFRVLYEGELAYFWPAQHDMLKRVRDVLGETEMFAGHAELESFKADVYVSSPNRTVGNSRQIWLLSQNRYVQDRGLQAAVTEAYRQLLMHGEYPVVVVNVHCDPEDVDVNVSPTKSQVKFRDASSAFRVVQRAVRGVLERAPWLTNVVGAQTESETETVAETDNRTQSFLSSEFSPVVAKQAELNVGGFSNRAKPLFEMPPKVTSTPLSAEVTSSARWGSLHILGQAHLTYIVAQTTDAIMFVDQHAAHERVLFEKLMSSIRLGQVEVQNFLLPPVVTVNEDAAQALIAAQADLAKWGIYLDLLSPTEVAVNAAPALARAEAIPPLIEKLASEIAEFGGSFSVENKMADRIATLACHSAIRAGQVLGHTEMQSLLDQMDEFALSSFCPHGRPVYVKYPIRQLEKDFGRIT
jgi:DNA mismatch repair protein MutL